jgi:hypothetical protein
MRLSPRVTGARPVVADVVDAVDVVAVVWPAEPTPEVEVVRG